MTDQKYLQELLNKLQAMRSHICRKYRMLSKYPLNLYSIFEFFRYQMQLELGIAAFLNMYMQTSSFIIIIIIMSFIAQNKNKIRIIIVHYGPS